MLPLTPALSPSDGEGEKPVCAPAEDVFSQTHTVFPLPIGWGEGQGEGERYMQIAPFYPLSISFNNQARAKVQ